MNYCGDCGEAVPRRDLQTHKAQACKPKCPNCAVQLAPIEGKADASVAERFQNHIDSGTCKSSCIDCKRALGPPADAANPAADYQERLAAHQVKLCLIECKECNRYVPRRVWEEHQCQPDAVKILSREQALMQPQPQGQSSGESTEVAGNPINKGKASSKAGSKASAKSSAASTSAELA